MYTLEFYDKIRDIEWKYNFNLMYLLYKLQRHNSKLILKHRSKIQELGKELV